MRKHIFIPSLILIIALALSACSAGASTAPATGTEAVGVPETGATGTVPAGGVGTETAGPVVTPVAETTAATTDASNAATAAATVEATIEATAGTAEGTSAPSIIETQSGTADATAAGTAVPDSASAAATSQGVTDEFVRLSILLDSNLSSGSDTGDVTGVVIAQPQPAANNVAAVEAPYVRYVVVKNAAGDMLLPWQMFSFDPASSTASGISQNFTLEGSAASRTNAPAVTLPAEMGVLTAGFDSQVSEYWASEGFSVPVTGATDQQPAAQVLLREQIAGTNIVGSDSQALGQVGDFLIDSATGEFAYAVFNGGQALGNREFLVPVQNLDFQLEKATAAGLGNIQLDITPELLSGAPTIEDINQVPLDPALLQQLNDFWQSMQNNK